MIKGLDVVAVGRLMAGAVFIACVALFTNFVVREGVDSWWGFLFYILTPLALAGVMWMVTEVVQELRNMRNCDH